MSIQNLDNSTFKDLLNIGGALKAEISKPEQGGKRAFVVVPAGVTALDITQYYPPQDVVGTLHTTDPQGFVDYVKRFHTPDSLVFAKLTPGDDNQDGSLAVVAILDYHRGSAEGCGPKPNLCQHKIMFSPEFDYRFQRWSEMDGERTEQEDFAVFLEENADMFANPQGAKLLEIVQDLYATKSISCQSSLRLQSGTNQIDYSEDAVMKSGTGKRVQLPSILEAQFPVFRGCVHVKVKARLKFRIEARKLVLWYETIAQQEIVPTAAKLVLDDIRGKLPKEVQVIMASQK